jgi:hypothetical protein
MTIQSFKDYILRKLGHPVVNIEMDETQIQDCIDDALKMFVENHFDGVDFGWIMLELNPEIDTYVLSENIQAVTEIKVSNGFTNIFDEPLLIKPNVFGYDGSLGASLDLTDVEIYRQNFKMYEDYFKTTLLFDYNSTSKKLLIEGKPPKAVTAAIKVYSSFEDDDIAKSYDNIWVRKYAVALAKIQWGQNISKFSNATLPGGVQLNGEQIKQEGIEERNQLELDLDEIWSEPADPLCG